MRGNLLRAVSHDIRTPLTSIVGGVSTLLDSGDQLDEATRTQLLENIRDESNWLVSVVENLLSVTRMTGEQTKIKKEMEAGEEVPQRRRHEDQEALSGDHCFRARAAGAADDSDGRDSHRAGADQSDGELHPARRHNHARRDAAPQGRRECAL